MTSDTDRRRRVLVVDDHEIVRLGIRQLISTESDLIVCGEAATAEEALTLSRTALPDLAIVDLCLDNTPGLELVRQLHEASPELPVLVLSMHDEALFAERAIRAGARGYIMKKGAIVGLVHAMRELLSGRVYASESVSQGLLRGLGDTGASGRDPLAGLTDRELEVFEMIGRGISTATIADNLRLSIKTIETYRSNIKQKLNLRDATELIRVAVSRTLQM
jgi:DNA-binding NarL/FixJ family response regulator